MRKILFKKITIVGVGLIGGSLGLAIKRKRLARQVVGVSRKDSTLREAVSQKAVDVGTKDLREAVRGADLVILCAPVFTIIEQIKKIQPWVKNGALIIDVGSSKNLIVSEAKKRFKKNPFVGCHPMAGLEKKGCVFAQADLFEDSICFVTKRHPKVEALWKALGCTTVRIAAKTHDAWVAQFSHLPHALAFTLFQSFPKRPGSLKASNPSLRDLARISKSDPKLWSDILLSNREEIIKSLTRFRRDLVGLEKAIRSKNIHGIISYISKANRLSHHLTPNVH